MRYGDCVKFIVKVLSGGSTVVEYSTQNPKIEGLNPADGLGP